MTGGTGSKIELLIGNLFQVGCAGPAGRGGYGILLLSAVDPPRNCNQ